MQVELAKSAGFCFGVQRAVDTVHKQIEENSANRNPSPVDPVER